MLDVHGHPEYGTEIIWHDSVCPPDIWIEKVQEYQKKVKEYSMVK